MDRVVKGTLCNGVWKGFEQREFKGRNKCVIGEVEGSLSDKILDSLLDDILHFSSNFYCF